MHLLFFSKFKNACWTPSEKKSSLKLDKQANEEFLRILDKPYELFVGQECISHGQIWLKVVPA